MVSNVVSEDGFSRLLRNISSVPRKYAALNREDHNLNCHLSENVWLYVQLIQIIIVSNSLKRRWNSHRSGKAGICLFLLSNMKSFWRHEVKIPHWPSRNQWSWVVIFKVQKLYSIGRTRGFYWIGCIGWSGRDGWKEHYCQTRESKSDYQLRR